MSGPRFRRASRQNNILTHLLRFFLPPVLPGAHVATEVYAADLDKGAVAPAIAALAFRFAEWHSAGDVVRIARI